MLNQRMTPLYSKVIEHARKNPHSFHVPGHKWGHVFPEFAKKIYESILRLDATEIAGLDDLHDAQSVIKEAQQLLANVYGANTSYFLVGGSTVGNLAMILSVCSKDDIILVQRDSHKSVVNGIQLAQANAIYLTPDFDEKTGLSIGVGLETVQKALNSYPSAKTIILTNPSYYGVTIDLREIIECAHTLGIPVLVDEAHGAHFGVGDGFPRSAISQGADLVVQSAHKTLPAMTMGSYLHYNSLFVSKKSLEFYLQTLQSSSPSYPIMASLDLARHYMANLKEDEVLSILESSRKFRELLKEVPQITVVELDETVNVTLDPLKVILRTKCELTGIDIQSLLEDNGLFVELANEEYLLLVLPLVPFDQSEQIVSLIRSVLMPYKTIDRKIGKKNIGVQKISSFHLKEETVDQCKTEYIPIEQAVGYLIAEQVIPYPPGVPLLIPGEIITNETIETLLKLLDAGAKFQGHTNIKQTGLKVFTIDDRKEDEK